MSEEKTTEMTEQEVLDPLAAFRDKAINSPDGHVKDESATENPDDLVNDPDHKEVVEPATKESVEDKSKTKSKPTKEESFAALRKKAEEAEAEKERITKELESYRQRLEEGKALLDRKDDLAPILESIDSEFDGKVEEYLTVSKTRAKQIEELETELKAREQKIEESDFERSEWYIKNVSEPFEDARTTMLATVEGDQALFTAVWNIAAQNDGPLTHLDKSEIGKLVKDHSLAEYLNPKMVWEAVADLKRVTAKVNEASQNRRELIEKIKTQRHEEAVKQHADTLNMRLNLMNEQSKKSTEDVKNSVKTTIGDLLDEEKLQDGRKKSSDFLEAIMVGSAEIDFADTSARIYKSEVFDMLFEGGVLKDLIDKSNELAELQRGAAPSGGQPSKSTGETPSGEANPLDALRAQHTKSGNDNANVHKLLSGA